MKRSLLLILIACQIGYGQDSVYLHKSDAAPFEGFLLPQAKVEEFHRNAIELANTKLLNDSFQKSLNIQNSITTINEQKINIVTEQNNTLSKALYDERTTSDVTKILWFSLGVAATILSLYGASKIPR